MVNPKKIGEKFDMFNEGCERHHRKIDLVLGVCSLIVGFYRFYFLKQYLWSIIVFIFGSYLTIQAIINKNPIWLRKRRR